MEQSPLFVKNMGWSACINMVCLCRWPVRFRRTTWFCAPVGTGLVPVRGLDGRVAALRAGQPQGLSLHRIRPMQPPFSCYVGTGFIPVRIKPGSRADQRSLATQPKAACSTPTPYLKRGVSQNSRACRHALPLLPLLPESRAIFLLFVGTVRLRRT